MDEKLKKINNDNDENILSSSSSHLTTSLDLDVMMMPHQVPSSSEHDSVDTDFQIESAHKGVKNESEPMLGEESDEHYRLIVILMQGKKVGVATYQSVSNEINSGELMVSGSQDSDVLVLRMILAELDPSIMAINKSAPAHFYQALMSGREDHCTLMRRKGSDFDTVLAETRLALLTPAGMPSELLEQDHRKEKLVYLMCRLDLYRKSLAFRAMGCLVTILLEKKIVNELEDPTTPIPVTSFGLLQHDQVMMIDESSFAALQIFKADLPPSIHGLGAKKEGLSVFGMLNQTKSAGGERLLRKRMMYPSQDIALLNQRLSTIAFLKSSKIAHLIPQLQQAIQQMADLPRVMARIQHFKASLSDWDHLSQSLVNGLKIRQILLSMQSWAEDDDVIHTASSTSTPEPAVPSVVKSLLEFPAYQALLRVASIIYGTVDVDTSRKEGRIMIKHGVNDQLDDLRATFEGLDDFLHTLGLQQLRTYEGCIKALKCVYYPQKGFAMAVPTEYATAIVDVPGLSFIFRTEEYCYFKDEAMQKIDQDLGDVYCDIIDIEKDLIRQLSDFTLRSMDDILTLHELVAEIDCAMALSIVANQQHWCQPTLQQREEEICALEESRHPLLEFCTHQLIANDVDFTHERVKILTGPNGSGKSVFVKQVALAVFLAQIGSFVPATSATISVVDRIFTRISTKESVTIPQGSFMLELCQIADILNHATSNSLIVIDEFGKGTNEGDGLALLVAVINDLLQHHQPPPKTLVATHMSEIFQKGLLIENPSPSSYSHFSMAYHMAKGFDDPVYLYKVMRGGEGSSLATSVARSTGIPEQLILRAETILKAGTHPVSSVPELSKVSPYDQILLEFFQTDFDEIANLSAFKQLVLHKFESL